MQIMHKIAAVLRSLDWNIPPARFTDRFNRGRMGHWLRAKRSARRQRIGE